MKSKFLWLTLTFLVVLSLTFAACSEKSTSVTTSSTSTSAPVGTGTVSTSGTAHWWDKLGVPEYGGMLNLQGNNMDYVALDPQFAMGSGYNMTYETLFRQDRTVDPAVYEYKSSFTPVEYYQGELAESWEQNDPLTVTVHIRQGIHWPNKEPVNGRELTAEDIQYNADRLLGKGSGFSSPNPFLAAMLPYTERVVAIDNYTIQFKFKQASAIAIWDVFAPQLTIMAPEWVELYGSTFTMPGTPGGGGGSPAGEEPISSTSTTSSALPTKGSSDWHGAISTAPYDVTDFIATSSITFGKVDNYYLHDERFPDNKLPYIDTVKVISIVDMSTAMAALRTMKIDKIGGSSGGGSGSSPTWQQAVSMQKTNPEVQVWWIPTEGPGLQMRCDEAPFTDIRIRQALNMAIDRELIAETHYGGNLDPTPCGLILGSVKGWSIPYAEWSDELKGIYSYNPTGAKQLLAEAGYPNGFDTDIVSSTTDDIELIQIIKSMFQDIGVNMEIITQDSATAKDYVSGGKYNGLTSVFGQTGGMLSPWMAISVMKTGDRQNATHNDSATFESMYEKIVTSTSIEEARSLTSEADQYVLEQCWQIFLFPGANAVLVQPYVKGYNGEYVDSGIGNSRFWIDQELRATLVK